MLTYDFSGTKDDQGPEPGTSGSLPEEAKRVRIEALRESFLSWGQNPRTLKNQEPVHDLYCIYPIWRFPEMGLACGARVAWEKHQIDLQTHEFPTDQENLCTWRHLDALSRERGTQKNAFLSRNIAH